MLQCDYIKNATEAYWNRYQTAKNQHFSNVRYYFAVSDFQALFWRVFSIVAHGYAIKANS
jgi:hypothetical protein